MSHAFDARQAFDENPMNDKPDHQRPELPAFWDKRFGEGSTPWAAEGVPAALRIFAEATTGRLATLIPGCGHAREAAWLAQRGWSVTALDFSASAIETARAVLGDWPGTLVQGDFFSFVPPTPFELIYERAFLCALPRKCWPAYGKRMADLLLPGGRLAGYFFFQENPVGPPFGITPAQLDELLTPWFVREDDQAVGDSVPVFEGKERWQVWRKIRPNTSVPPAAGDEPRLRG